MRRSENVVVSNRITIKLSRCLMVLTEGEMMALLRERPEIWAQGLQRGKWERRRHTEDMRKPKAKEVTR